MLHLPSFAEKNNEAPHRLGLICEMTTKSSTLVAEDENVN
jgi:hypothetical protein